MNLMPQWTERAEKRGLDPLGMQNAGVQLYQELVPGISNVTLRVRYYGLYCWASEAYAREVGSTDTDQWRQWIRRLEALHALVAARDNRETGVAGILWAYDVIAAGDDPIDFSICASTDPQAVRYLRQSFGVFGQAYLSQMVELGLFYYDAGENHDLPIRSARGLALGRAFAAAIGPELEALLIKGITSAKTTLAELDQLRSILPSHIVEGEERDGIEDLLLARGDDATKQDQSRRETLLLILNTAQHLGRKPRADDVRRHAFFGDMALPESLEAQRLRWEAYQAQDVWQMAAAALLAWAIEVINTFEEGQSLPEIHAQVIASIAEHWPSRMNLDWQAFCEGADCSDHEFAERWSRLTSRRETAQILGLGAFEVMAAIAARLDQRDDLRAEVADSFALQGGGRSIRSELQWLQGHRHASLPELLADYVIQRVVSRHTWVATQKLRRQHDYTFLFEAREGRLAYRAQYEPVPTTPRLDPAIQFLVDIRLIDDKGLTARGRALIEALA